MLEQQSMVLTSSRRPRKLLLCIVGACLVLLCLDHRSWNFTPPPPSKIAPALEAWQSPWSSTVAAALGVAVVIAGNAPPALGSAPGRWTYRENGQDWGAEFPLCDGLAQTPVNILERDVAKFGEESLISKIEYKPTDTDIVNIDGKTVQANGNFGHLYLPDGLYEVKQFHFHFPAEHQVEGKLFAGELHIVHQKRGSSGLNDLAVLGILLKESDSSDGPEGDWFRQLYFGDQLPPKSGMKKSIVKMDLNAFSSQFGSGYYHYQGSLTTPPCAETVHWYVLKRGAPMTKNMLDSFRAVFPANNRRILNLNGRSLVSSDLALPGEYPIDLKNPKAGTKEAARVGSSLKRVG